ncbi:MAG: CvpA family protein [Salinivirgaceae bacterium]|nr:CvpA family protein [Salinivirgaceae bacterium]
MAQTFDIIVLILLGISAVTGIFKGLITMLTSLVAILLGAWLTMKFSYITGGFLQQHFNFNEQYVTVASFVITFLAVVVGVHLLGKTISSLVKAIALGWVDKILGLVFSVLRSAFIISAIVSALSSFGPTSSLFNGEIKNDSKLYNKIAPIAPFVFDQLNFNLGDHIPTVPTIPSDLGDILPEDAKIL